MRVAERETKQVPSALLQKSVVIMGLYLVEICKTVCFEHNVQKFVVLYFGHFLDYQNSFDNCSSGGSTHATYKVCCKSVRSPRRSLKK